MGCYFIKKEFQDLEIAAEMQASLEQIEIEKIVSEYRIKYDKWKNYFSVCEVNGILHFYLCDMSS